MISIDKNQQALNKIDKEQIDHLFLVELISDYTFGTILFMRKFYRHIVDFFSVITKYLVRPRITEVSNKKLLTKKELANYFDRSISWIYTNVEKGGALMNGVHIFEFCGVTVYDIEKIETDIKSGSIK